ncbi:MAG: NAD-dependent epimerase [Bradyrhizobium sp.]|nr:NAD-dependent epimerase [Bradyrhizobium sp.]
MNNEPEEVMRVVDVLEKTLGKGAIKQFLQIQRADVAETYADDLTRRVGYTPQRLPLSKALASSSPGCAVIIMSPRRPHPLPRLDV